MTLQPQPIPASQPTRATSPGRLGTMRAAAMARWQALAPRERQWLTFAAWLTSGTLVWLLGVQQPLEKGLRAQAQRLVLDEQWLVMQEQAAQARALRAVAPLPAGQAEQALQAATARLGPRGRLSRQGDRAVLTLDGVSPSELQGWWAQARAGARARAVEMQVSRSERGLTGSLTVSLEGPP